MLARIARSGRWPRLLACGTAAGPPSAHGSCDASTFLRPVSTAAGEREGGATGAAGRSLPPLAFAGAALAGAAWLLWPHAPGADNRPPPAAAPHPTPPAETGNWPVYTRAQVAAHATRETRVWVTVREGVYDVTDFLASHPGGADKLLLAAGKSADPFWALYPQHNKSPAVPPLLARMRIGTLDATDAATESASLSRDDPYGRDPPHHPALAVIARSPATAEPPLPLLTQDHVTPAALWFVRSHHPVPGCALGGGDSPQGSSQESPQASSPHDETHAVTVDVPGAAPRAWTVGELKASFPKRTVTATLQCGGNRRSEADAVHKTAGIGWGPGAISTAAWGGAALADVLRASGVDGGAAGHVVFAAADGMTASVPAAKATDPAGDVLLAYEMNGQPLPPHHGRPLRAIIPGTVGVRSVKWVTRVSLSAEEATGPWQRGIAYKPFPPGMQSAEGLSEAQVAALPSMQDMPIQSALSSPAPGTPLPLGEDVALRGYAYSGGGRAVLRVDVSADGGRTWTTARLDPRGAAQPNGRAWAWTLFEAEVPLPGAATPGDSVELVCKAVDSAWNTQPESVASVWNLRGLGCNAWHRVRCVVAPPPDEG